MRKDNKGNYRKYFGMNYIRYLFLAFTILSLIYSVSIYMVGSGTFSFMIWIFSAIVFGLLFYLSGNGRWIKIPFGIRCAGYLTIGLTAIFFTICFIAMASHFNDKGEGSQYPHGSFKELKKYINKLMEA